MSTLAPGGSIRYDSGHSEDSRSVGLSLLQRRTTCAPHTFSNQPTFCGPAQRSVSAAFQRAHTKSPAAPCGRISTSAPSSRACSARNAASRSSDRLSSVGDSRSTICASSEASAACCLRRKDRIRLVGRHVYAAAVWGVRRRREGGRCAHKKQPHRLCLDGEICAAGPALAGRRRR